MGFLPAKQSLEVAKSRVSLDEDRDRMPQKR
jgi:hypothetical protein